MPSGFLALVCGPPLPEVFNPPPESTMSRHCHLPPMLIAWPVLTASVFVSTPAAATDQMTFKNNLLPGHLTVHKISRLIHRKAPRKGHTEKLSYAQVAEWVQCNLDEPKPGSVTVYQMMVDRPAKVLSVFHGAKKIRPTPPPERFNLSKGSTRLYSVTKGPRDAPYQVPICDPAEQAVLRVMLDFAHWPRKKIDAGHRWERDISDGGFKGTQTLEFVDLVRVKKQVAARLTLYIEGSFDGVLQKDYAFVKGQAIIHWLRLDRTLLKMEGRVEYTRRRPNGDETYELELNIGLKSLVSHTADEQELMKEQLTKFAQALKKQREDLKSDAKQLCREFRHRWPDAYWLPAVEELEDRLTPKKRRGKRLKTSELKKIIGRSVIAWKAAEENHEYDMMDQTRKALEEINRDYREKLLQLARSKKSTLRAQAMFALAFSGNPEDFHLVQKATRDGSAKVRGMALAGIAARRDPKTSVEMLMLLLDDKKGGVRAQACRAVAACVPREHFSVAKVVERITQLMIHDKKHTVRLEAIHALAAIGAPADIPRLEKALTHELDKTNRRAIEAAIEKLESAND